MHAKFLAGFMAAGFLFSPLGYAADHAPKKAKPDDEMAQAIAFERHKDAAAARQARIEAKHPTVFDSRSEAGYSADRDASAQKDGAAGPDQSKRQPQQRD